MSNYSYDIDQNSFKNLLLSLIPWKVLIPVYGKAFGLVTTNPLLTSYITVLYLPSSLEPTVSCFGVVDKVNCDGVAQIGADCFFFFRVTSGTLDVFFVVFLPTIKIEWINYYNSILFKLQG